MMSGKAPEVAEGALNELRFAQPDSDFEQHQVVSSLGLLGGPRAAGSGPVCSTLPPPVGGKSVLVRQLLGPHLRTCP